MAVRHDGISCWYALRILASLRENIVDCNEIGWRWLYSEVERDAMKSEISKSLRRLDPDEMDDPHIYGIRTWWD